MASHVEYSSNNSGGSWWLKDKHWKALEDAGWKVSWGGLFFCGEKSYSFSRKPVYEFEPCPKGKCVGHPTARTHAEMVGAGQEARWLGALATKAIKPECDSLRDAAGEWERITGMSATDAGCACCGQPHTFTLYRDGKYIDSGPSTSYEASW